MRSLRLATAAVAVGLVAAAMPAWSHIPAVGTTIFEELEVTSSDTGISVSGLVTYGGQSPVVLATDAAGDNTGGAATQPLGVDLTGLALAQREADSEDLTFELRLADLRTPRGTPESVQYNWDVEVDGGAARGGSNWSIKTMGTRLSTASLSPWAAVHTCEPGGTANASFTCTQTTPVEAVYDTASKTVYVNVPMSAIGAKPGSVISAWPRAGSPVWVGATAAGARTLIETYDGVADHARFTVPSGPSVEVTVTSAGTGAPVDHTRLDARTGDRFSSAIGVGPGTYDVTVQACFAGNCATRVVETTVGS